MMPGFRGGGRGGRGLMPFGGRGGRMLGRPGPPGSRVYIGNLAWNVQWQVKGMYVCDAYCSAVCVRLLRV
jgi:hypothetical protein